jgi:UDP-sugar diphosphatase
MDNVTEVRVGKLPDDSPYMKPFRLFYKQGGNKEKNWGKLFYFIDLMQILFLNCFRPCQSSRQRCNNYIQ